MGPNRPHGSANGHRDRLDPIWSDLTRTRVWQESLFPMAGYSLSATDFIPAAIIWITSAPLPELQELPELQVMEHGTYTTNRCWTRMICVLNIWTLMNFDELSLYPPHMPTSVIRWLTCSLATSSMTRAWWYWHESWWLGMSPVKITNSGRPIPFFFSFATRDMCSITDRNNATGGSQFKRPKGYDWASGSTWKGIPCMAHCMTQELNCAHTKETCNMEKTKRRQHVSTLSCKATRGLVEGLWDSAHIALQMAIPQKTTNQHIPGDCLVYLNIY